MIKLKDYTLVDIISNCYTPVNEDYPEEHMEECRDIKFTFQSSNSNEEVIISFESFSTSYYDSPYTLKPDIGDYIIEFLDLAQGNVSESMTLSEFIVWFCRKFTSRATSLKIMKQSKEHEVFILKSDEYSSSVVSDVITSLYDTYVRWNDYGSNLELVLDLYDLVAIAKSKSTVVVCSAQKYLEVLGL